MSRLGVLVLNIAVALYLFANGILGFNTGRFDDKGAFYDMAKTIFKNNSGAVDTVTIILSVIGIIAGVLLILKLLNIAIPQMDLLMLVIIIVWAVVVVIVNIIQPLQDSNPFQPFLSYLLQLSAHLMVLGALISSKFDS